MAVVLASPLASFLTGARLEVDGGLALSGSGFFNRALQAASNPDEVTDMKTRLQCPCGELIQGKDEDELVENVQKHLREQHPDHEYSREEILFMAY